MTGPVRIAVAGAGLIGRRHIAAIAATPGVELHSIIDPSDAGRDQADRIGASWHGSLSGALERDRPDGIVLATPNQVHVENALECVAAGVPALIEKPLATDLEAGHDLVVAGENAGVALLVGHHRRHNPLIAAARKQISDGLLGALVAVHGMFWLMKPDDYFDTEWRRQPGGGPIFLNLIHDIDLLRHLIGEIVSVQALASSAVRGNAVEETAALVLRFDNGVLGTFSLSDTIVSPWSWELTASENPAYPPTGQSCYFIGGTHGSMELPNARVWTNHGKRSWWEPISATHHPVSQDDPLVRQIAQFARVIRGEEPPLVPAREGLRTLQVIDAVQQSARSGQTVVLS
ncbi:MULTISPECIES: Gfo/Idh/MocA family protein [Hoeflea]|uniref:Gfo/Idh/MocA family oxidoreductase n=1 Tax=Hoeflea alexandrii TaxID=288436 RepID=A0ABT1CS92_9HYPH|nr:MULTISPECIES: Gfo/Idh/MocA family oxidoreductase [Hoeflea]MCO6409018.1 Gfo/Idh/MocA family oxidoreductase [Hoeflea alexandrii]VVT29911.1 Predicted dehydrogenase [Hoeflea sp. EC-HK425]